MTKVQLLYDYLIMLGDKIGLSDEGLNITTLSRKVTGDTSWESDSHYKTTKIAAVIVVDDFDFLGADIDKLEFALKYWLDRFDKNAEFIVIPETKTSSTSDLWIDIELTEDSWVDDKGDIQKCFESQDFTNNEVANDLIIILKRINGEEKQLFPKS